MAHKLWISDIAFVGPVFIHMLSPAYAALPLGSACAGFMPIPYPSTRPACRITAQSTPIDACSAVVHSSASPVSHR
ncbi:exported hypothetical protein [Xanthomonas phaseoli pv. phaseoli]|uniref:Secreted protein n=1 Tax=Xanthomonas campestris pv. phaseoli TaxID=317013 RepID=A0AB38DW36_XANCH|nr:exported hypothetical protein [Xanthomonas phaseoli pv. phaseoli]SON80205.1 exported hypothetical protein [Xanthomonas phaseoli pv. phaseoli]SON82724.1 exported hypothetical protein [Xanthomonas phaseoli pv. phaseoli]SOO30120.1 exported hypothetical protein [Xanthomonas phaseoli pv. phaseoli]